MGATVDFLRGNGGKALDITLMSLGRAAEIAGGIAVTGNWDKDAWKNALGGSLSVQAFIFAYAYLNRNNSQAVLPSAESATAIVRGEVEALPTLALHWIGRSALVGLGMYAFGEREKLPQQAMAGAAVIEASILLWAWKQSRVEAPVQ